MNKFGLPQRAMDEMHAIFAKHSKVKKVVLYGSRAMGNYKNGSDIDLTMYGSALTFDDLNNIAGELEESSIPYLVDLSIFDMLDHAKLKDHIKRYGRVFYDRYAGWKAVKLGDVCDLVGGGTPSKKMMLTMTDIPWATVRDMNVDELCLTEHKINGLGLKNSSSKVIPKNNVIIASRVGLGKVWLLLALVLQITLGISTLLLKVPVVLASAHQAGGLVLLTGILIVLHKVLRPSAFTRYCH